MRIADAQDHLHRQSVLYQRAFIDHGQGAAHEGLGEEVTALVVSAQTAHGVGLADEVLAQVAVHAEHEAEWPRYSSVAHKIDDMPVEPDRLHQLDFLVARQPLPLRGIPLSDFTPTSSVLLVSLILAFRTYGFGMASPFE